MFLWGQCKTTIILQHESCNNNINENIFTSKLKSKIDFYQLIIQSQIAINGS